MTTKPTTLSSAPRTGALVWLAVVAAAIAAIAILHRLGADPAFAIDWDDPNGWLSSRSPERVLLGVVRLASLALAYWIAGSLVLYTAARASRIPALIRSVEWLTLPAVRQVAERAVVVTLTVSTFTAGGTAALAHEQAVPDAQRPGVGQVDQDTAPATAYVPVPAGDTPITIPVPTGSEPEETYTPVPAGSEASSEVAPPPPGLHAVTHAAAPAPPLVVEPDADLVAPAVGAQPSALESYPYSVVAGDNLWTLASAHLESVLGRAPTEAETATYWSHMIEANRAQLRSGNPDLIFPGEVVTCPPTADVGLGT